MNFQEAVFMVTARIPQGKVATYGQIAEMIGKPKSAQAVGNALHRNRDPIKVPCHRVVNRHGELAAHFGMGGAAVQKERLLAEGVTVIDGKVDVVKYQWDSEKI